MGSMIEQQSGEKAPNQTTLVSIIIGLAAGLIAYGVNEYWITQADRPVTAITLVYTILIGALSFMFMTEAGKHRTSAIHALAISLIIAPSSFYMASIATNPETVITEVPLYGWFILAGPACAYLLASLSRGLQTGSTGSAYASVFLSGLTLPLVAISAALFGLLCVIFFYAVPFMLENIGVTAAQALFQAPWVLMPLLGALAGFSIAFIRNRHAFLSAVQFLLLLLSRFAIPLIAVISISIMIAGLATGFRPVFQTPTAGLALTGFCFVGMLALNGIYQNGDPSPPALWVRLPFIISVLIWPLLCGVALYALMNKNSSSGMTPEGALLITITGLIVLYSLSCAISLVSEINWRGTRWLPALAPINMAMALLWAMAILALASPIADPWAMSARSQKQSLLSGERSVEDFDFGYLKFNLGRHGERVLQDLQSVTSHPQARAISDGATRALTAATQWEYENSTTAALPRDRSRDQIDNGPMELRLNPVDNPDRDDTASSNPE